MLEYPLQDSLSIQSDWSADRNIAKATPIITFGQRVHSPLDFGVTSNYDILPWGEDSRAGKPGHNSAGALEATDEVGISTTPVNPRNLVGIDVRVGALALGWVNSHICPLSFPSRRRLRFPALIFYLSISLCNPPACDSALIEGVEEIHTIARSYDGSLKSCNSFALYPVAILEHSSIPNTAFILVAGYPDCSVNWKNTCLHGTGLAWRKRGCRLRKFLDASTQTTGFMVHQIAVALFSVCSDNTSQFIPLWSGIFGLDRIQDFDLQTFFIHTCQEYINNDYLAMTRSLPKDIPNPSYLPRKSNEHANGRCNAAVTRSEHLWPNNSIIKYSYIGGAMCQYRKVDSTMREWSRYTNIRFKRVDSGGTIRISFDYNDGSWSCVGQQCKSITIDEATMNLDCIDPSTNAVTSEERGIILHEFGHALGLLHEHQSPSRSGVLTFNEALTKQYYQDLYSWQATRVEEQVLRLHGKHDVSGYSEMDPTSIMMYGVSYTTNFESWDIPDNFEISDMDKAYMFLNYPRLKPHKRSPEWTIVKALDVSGVTDPRRKDILNTRCPDRVRKLFAQWNVEKRLPGRAALA